MKAFSDEKLMKMAAEGGHTITYFPLLMSGSSDTFSYGSTIEPLRITMEPKEEEAEGVYIYINGFLQQAHMDAGSLLDGREWGSASARSKPRVASGIPPYITCRDGKLRIVVSERNYPKQSAIVAVRRFDDAKRKFE
jgi:hypothetical protein